MKPSGGPLLPRKRAAVLVGLLALCLPHGAAAQEPVEDHYWQLGTGYYFGGISGAATELDYARFDWLYLCLGNIAADESTVEVLNRLLALNPRLRILIRVWPIGELGDCKQNGYQATFLHYLYAPGVREKLLAETRRQIRVILDNLSRPENVVGATFLEELPLHFSGAPFYSNADGQPVSWDLERFRADIEAERGKPLVWDDETRRWWGEKWCQVLGEIHDEMKRALEGRLVFYYQQTNHSSLDMHPPGTPLNTPMLVPVSWRDIIRPGVCDGFFAYPNSEAIWEGYVRLAREHNWLFFSQVSHPPYRLCSWDECLRLAKTRVPQNLGYFFYCEGNCAASRAWNVDPGIPAGPEWNTAWASEYLHMRRHLAMEQVGLDVLAAQPALRLLVDLPVQEATGGGWLHPRVIVQNTREASCYLDPEEAVVRNVTVTLAVPEGFAIPAQNSPPPTIPLGDLRPGECRVADWWVSVQPRQGPVPAGAFILTGTAQNSPPTVVELHEDTAIPWGQAHEVRASGTEWVEAAYRLSEAQVQPRIVMDCLAGPVRDPALSDGVVTLRYEGALETGTRLVLDPRQGARLFHRPLLDDDGQSRADPNDPCGFRGWAEGYLVVNLRVSRPVTPGQTLKVTITGKAGDGGQSLVNARFTARGENRDVVCLANAFGEQWGQAQETITVPADADTLDRLYLYRFKQMGRVWYGPVRVERADLAPEGEDVTARVRGGYPTLTRDAFRVFRYTDAEPPSGHPRMRVQLQAPEDARQ